MSNERLIVQDTDEYTPEEAALTMRLRVFVNMRWLAILGVAIATLVASEVFHIGFPTLPVYIICPFIALYNLVFLYQVRGLGRERPGLVIHKAKTYSNLHIFFDLITLTVLLHFAGGIENPFIFVYVLHIILAAIGLHYRVVYVIATAALLMVSLLVGLEYAEVIPHVNLEGFAIAMRYLDVSHILAVLAALAAILYGTTYMATAISGELRKRQRQVVQLREQLLDEKMGEIEQASKEVARLEGEKDQFLRFIGIAAHDLKAPLTAIQGFLWVMLGGYAGEISDKQKNMLERSTRRISELLKLISDLLDIPRAETGQIVSEMKEISLNQVIRNRLQDQRKLAKEKGLQLKIELSRTSPRIRGSSPRLQQVMTNLVDNAINYTPEGTVTIRVTEKGREMQVEVMDTGIGIPPDDVSQIFDDFFRASNVEVRGTGLGLSISRRIVEAHGGRIWCESPCLETNQGSKFTFTVPMIRGDKRRRKQ